jgi:hypothetical protein
MNLLEHARAVRRKWTEDRIARLGFLVGLGWDAQRVADDPVIASNRNNVFRQVQRFGLGFRAAANAIAEELPEKVNSCLDKAALKRGITREAMIKSLLFEISSDTTLLDNILDDGINT